MPQIFTMSADARNLYHEGIIIPPVKLYEEGRLNESMMRLLMRNSRTPYLLGGDLRGQGGSVRQGGELLKQLCREYGVHVVVGSFTELMNITERRMHAELAALPDGDAEVERYLDCDGVDLTKPVTIRLRLQKRGDRISLDFSLELHAGDVLRHELSGGGGYGNPLERDRDAVLRDVQNGYVSAEAAEKDYGLEKATLETIK